MKRWLIVGLASVLFLAVVFVFLIPGLQPRCQRWYHSVDFIADQNAEEDLGRALRRDDFERDPRLQQRAWEAAVEEVGAKPFYCN